MNIVFKMYGPGKIPFLLCCSRSRVLFMCILILLHISETYSQNKIYYVDNIEGNNNNDGTTEKFVNKKRCSILLATMN